MARKRQASVRELERATGSAAAREAQGKQERERAKRSARFERGQKGQPGARSREPVNAEH